MKILHINGSPKREGSDTMHIARAFLAGMAEAADVETETIHVIDQTLLEEIASPMIPEDVYAQIANGEATP